MKNNSKRTITVLLIFTIAAIIFYPKYKPLLSNLFSKKDQAPAGPNPGQGGRGSFAAGRQMLNVSGFLIEPTSMSDLYRSTGQLRPDEEVDLAFETSGKIVGINFAEGTRVKKGDLLAKMNDKPLQAQLQKLMAQKKLLEEKEFRQRSLLEKDAISQESYDQIVTELQTMEADINLIKARISETELYAPFDGIIGMRYLSEGSYANPSTKIARLVKISPIKIDFSISERYANQVNIGFPVTFTLEGDNKIYEASVYAVDPRLDEETRTITIRALHPNRNEELKPGRFAPVTLLLSKIDNTIAIPSEAITPEMEGEMVYVYRKGKAAISRVTTGLRTESLVQITDGLKFGDTLITTGILQLRQGLPVVLDTLIINQ
ncbi:MAG: efflux RND transporter periplasmic adaptor subunit [Bacteroidales bacterium]|nr:efflux RND transporter periplasmic adaptor subunit [Bacteroidales bacterium]MBN2633351.1 efflux RND transporter periplasmic adaptor subunit [Bacteroidales bacterium]